MEIFINTPSTDISMIPTLQNTAIKDLINAGYLDIS